MMTRDEAVSARVAALRLERLYHAYRATHQANGMVLTRLRAELQMREDDAERRERLEQRMLREFAVSRESDAVFRERAQQVSRRIDELDRYEAP